MTNTSTTPANLTSGFDIAAVPTGSIHDFDFLIGDWRVVNHRLVARNVGCDEWDEFTAEQHVEQWLGGVVNIDETHFAGKDFAGLTMRAFDRAAQRWSIYWVNSARGTVDPPVHGGFDGDHGRFYGEDLDDGVPVHAVFAWTRIGTEHARWEQAFSYDGGATWETNWVMDFTRVRG